jgi:hypothetical protein
MNTGMLDCTAKDDWLSRPLEESDFELMHQDQDHSLMWRTEAPMDTLMLFCCDDGATHEGFLTVQEIADRLSVKPKTIRNKMAQGIFKKGTHYYSPRGFGPRFKWSAVKALIESENSEGAEECSDGIPMARRYTLHSRA